MITKIGTLKGTLQQVGKLRAWVEMQRQLVGPVLTAEWLGQLEDIQLAITEAIEKEAR